MSWTLPDLPFFDAEHAALGARLSAEPPPRHVEPQSAEQVAQLACAAIKSLAGKNLLDIVVPVADASGARRIDVRALCIVREFFGYHDLLADTMFTMQGIGTAALWMAGTAAQQQRYLGACRAGSSIAALALTEPEAGSDVAAVATTARRDGNYFVIDGAKTLITNAGIADHYIVVARTGEEPGARGLSAFIVDADTPGLTIGEPLELIAPHPLGSLTFDGCKVPAANLIGEPGTGFKTAMAVFDIFRPSVGAAAVGVARRALDEAIGRVRERTMFGKPMAKLEGVQARIADMATDTETAALAVYRAAWAKDVTGARCSREASMAKLVGSEAAQRVVDGAVQLFGGRGIVKGYVVEQLYREVRGMRIYEGASEVQRMIIARELLA